MTNISHSPPLQGKPWTRDQVIGILGAAAAVNEYSFIRKASLSWLAAFPGDLPIQLIHAQSAAKDLGINKALPLIDKICQIDPEYAAAQDLRFGLLQKSTPDPISSGELFSR